VEGSHIGAGLSLSEAEARIRALVRREVEKLQRCSGERPLISMIVVKAVVFCSRQAYHR
jgi:hypothetical protein